MKLQQKKNWLDQFQLQSSSALSFVSKKFKLMETSNFKVIQFLTLSLVVFIMFVIAIVFVIFKRTSDKSKSSSFNPSTMSDYTIGKARYEASYHDSYQDSCHMSPSYEADQIYRPKIPGHIGQIPTHIPGHPFIQSPADFGSKIVTLYPNQQITSGQTMNQSQPASDFTFRPIGPNMSSSTGSPHQMALPVSNCPSPYGDERLSDRTDQTVLV